VTDQTIVSAVSVLNEIAAERQRQQTTEGWTAQHDDAHSRGEMADAAACYAATTYIFHALWPWGNECCKPKDRRSDLILAGALIVAEIERLDRASNGL